MSYEYGMDKIFDMLLPMLVNIGIINDNDIQL